MKRGRRSFGLGRLYPIQVDCTSDEDEFITRKAFSVMRSKSEFIRNSIFSKNPKWHGELEALRLGQQHNHYVWRKRTPRKNVKR